MPTATTTSRSRTASTSSSNPLSARSSPTSPPVSSRSPSAAQPIYYLDGVFYTQQGDNAYAVVNAPFRIIVPTLPSGGHSSNSRRIVVFYQFNGYNYTPVMQDGAVGYMVTPIS